MGIQPMICFLAVKLVDSAAGVVTQLKLGIIWSHMVFALAVYTRALVANRTASRRVNITLKATELTAANGIFRLHDAQVSALIATILLNTKLTKSKTETLTR